jgi:hypothetical protein
MVANISPIDDGGSVRQVRDRTWMYLTPNVAAAADMSLQDLQQFCVGAFTPAPEQI